MAIENYSFTYGDFQAEVHIEVDTEIFTDGMADDMKTFGWNISESHPTLSCVKIHALECVKESAEDKSMAEIIEAFRNKEGYWNIDGSDGIELWQIRGFEFSLDDLTKD